MPRSLDFIKEETGYLVKAEGEDKYIFEGVASSYGNEDSWGDIFEQDSLKKNYNQTVPMLVNHSWNVMDIIGKGVLDGEKDKILIKGNFTKGIEKAETITKLKNDAVPLKLSIGGRIKKWEMKQINGKYVRIIKEAEIIEVSVVFRGANEEAKITKTDILADEEIKKLDSLINRMTKLF